MQQQLREILEYRVSSQVSVRWPRRRHQRLSGRGVDGGIGVRRSAGDEMQVTQHRVQTVFGVVLDALDRCRERLWLVEIFLNGNQVKQDGDTW